MERSYATVDGPDVLIWSLVGRVSVDDIQQLYAVQTEFSRGKSDIYVIVDLQHMKQIDADARHAAGHGPLLRWKAHAGTWAGRYRRHFSHAAARQNDQQGRRVAHT